MKYVRLSFLAVLPIMVLSCTKEIGENQPVANGVITEINASFSDTKTILGDNGTSVLWSPKDEINVFYNEVGVKFTSLNTKPTAATIFSSDEVLIFGKNEDAASPYIYATYPYSEQNYQTGDTITLSVPTAQKAVKGSFGRGAFPSIGRSKTTDISFYNVCGGVRFSVASSGVKKVIFSGLNNEVLGGTVNVAFNEDGKPVVTSVVSGKKEISVETTDSNGFAPGAYYYISMLPSALSKGYRMVFYKDLTHATLEKTSSVEIKRSVFGSLENADAGLTYTDGGLGKIFTATLCSSSTKTSLNESNQMIWDNGQKVFLSDLDSVDTPVINKQNDQVGTLTTVKIKKDNVVGGIPAGYFSLDSELYCSIPEVQDGSFNSACIALAGDNGTKSLEFNPANAILKISLNQEVDSVRLTVSDSVYIAGKARVDLTGTPSISTIVGNAGSSIIAKPSSKRSEFYFGVIPCSSKGLTIEVYNDGGVARKLTTKEMTFFRGNLINMPIVTNLIFQVDLGLSVNWATCNLGASKPEEYGKYFAWGDVVGQTWNGSSWSGGGFSTYPTYKIDSNNNLKPEYDAACVLLGGTWRMPTKAECQELIDSCTVTLESNYKGSGVAGRIFTSKKVGYTDKSIFLPTSGYGDDIYLYSIGFRGYFWSSTFISVYYAYTLSFNSDGTRTTNEVRSNGQTIRPVSE